MAWGTPSHLLLLSLWTFLLLWKVLENQDYSHGPGFHKGFPSTLQLRGSDCIRVEFDGPNIYCTSISVLFCDCLILVFSNVTQEVVINKLNWICGSLFATLWVALSPGSHFLAGFTSGNHFAAMWPLWVYMNKNSNPFDLSEVLLLTFNLDSVSPLFPIGFDCWPEVRTEWEFWEGHCWPNDSHHTIWCAWTEQSCEGMQQL